MHFKNKLIIIKSAYFQEETLTLQASFQIHQRSWRVISFTFHNSSTVPQSYLALKPTTIGLFSIIQCFFFNLSVCNICKSIPKVMIVYLINSSRFQKEMFRLMYIMWVLYENCNVFACYEAKLVSYSLFIGYFILGWNKFGFVL